MRKFIYIALLLFSFTVRADYDEIIHVLKYVETLNEPSAVGDNGDSFGVLQVQRAVVMDVNRYFNTNYRHKDMFDEVCAEEVTILYMKMGSELYFKKYEECPTEEVLVRNHNGGIYRGYRINATITYYNEYLRWKKRLQKKKVKLNIN